MNNLTPDIRTMLYRVPVLLLSFMTHELAHALVAYKSGDMTAKDAGRISFNPLRHLDPFGSLMLIVVGFGWAKPVPINPNNFRNKRAGIIMTSLAGPLSNVLLAMLFYAAYIIFLSCVQPAPFIPLSGAGLIAADIFAQFFMVNISLAAFNLIPIPPLDGSKVLLSFLPERIYYNYILRYERYGMVVLMALSYTRYLGVILRPIIGFIQRFIIAVVKPVTSFFI